MINHEQNYQNSIDELTRYIQENSTIPTEKVWNQLAMRQDFLTSQTLGYLAGMKFSELCKNIYKQIQNKKKVS